MTRSSRWSPGCAGAATADSPVAIVCNFTPVSRQAYRVGLPFPGRWREVMNTDADGLWRIGYGQSRRVSRRRRMPSHGIAGLGGDRCCHRWRRCFSSTKRRDKREAPFHHGVGGMADR